MFLLFHFGRKGPLGSAFVMPAVGHQVGVLVYVLFHCCLLSLFAFSLFASYLVSLTAPGERFAKL